MMEKKWVRTSLQTVIVVLVLLALLMTGVRLLLTKAFTDIEYNMPYFPADPYGMTKEQRLKWGRVASEYLMNDADISFLGDLTFEDGSPLYNQRELSHMEDVKVLTKTFINAWVISYVGLAVLALASWLGGWIAEFKQMLSKAGLYTIIILATLVLFILLSFDALFTGFHRIFFEGDTWLFYYSDTLIRLFPIRFWQDAFIFAGGFTLLSGLGLWLGLRDKPKKVEE